MLFFHSAFHFFSSIRMLTYMIKESGMLLNIIMHFTISRAQKVASRNTHTRYIPFALLSTHPSHPLPPPVTSPSLPTSRRPEDRVLFSPPFCIFRLLSLVTYILWVQNFRLTILEAQGTLLMKGDLPFLYLSTILIFEMSTEKYSIFTNIFYNVRKNRI